VGAASTGAALAVAAAAGLSPLLAVRNVTWTGTLRLPEARCAAIEAAVLGRPLLFLSEAALQPGAGLDNDFSHIRLYRHLPATLEVRVEARRAVAQLHDGAAVDAEGRLLPEGNAVAGLPQLHGFELDAGGRRIAERDLLAALMPLFELPTLAPARIELRAEEHELELQLADSGARVRLDPEHVSTQILKLRVFEQSLGGEALPARIDLRFQDQVVVRDTGGRDARRAR